ncbi:MAG: hypothetical protein KGL53_06215 [Elusimicrobia bacterium]|nr:hypothetical protein [Elusimicrobiota bacterium]
MENETLTVDDEAGAGRLAEAEAEGAKRTGKLSRLVKLQTYQQLKEVIALDELRLKYMRHGIDVSRSRVISEAIKLLAQAVAEGKFELRG